MAGVVHVAADSEYAKNGPTDIGECACKARVPAHTWLTNGSITNRSLLGVSLPAGLLKKSTL